MGCGATRAVAVSPTSSKKNIKGGTSENTESGDIPYQDLAQNYEYLVNNCSSFKCPPGTVPIVCLDDDTIPVIESNLLLDESHQTGIFLPVIAANIQSKGRIICYGHVDMFNRNYFNSGDTANVLYNSFVWLNGKKTINSPIHFISFPSEYQSEMKSCFAPHGIHLVFDDFGADLTNETFIMIPTYFDLGDKEKLNMLNQILHRGGGIGIIYVPEKNTKTNFFPINKFLLTFGLSYSHCSLSDEYGTAITVKVYTSFDRSKRYSFRSLVEQFDKFVNTKNRNLSYLDDLATSIRYHVLASGKNHVFMIDQLLQLCWQYLRDTDYRLENGMFCPFVNHSIAAVLIDELYSKVPIEMVKDHLDVATTFPGIADPDTPFSEQSVTLQIYEDSLLSTGFWISPGMVSTVEGKNIPKGTRIQIGIHNVTLFTKPGPWKRWPMVISSYPFDGTKTSISSPFGGIVYLAIPDLSSDKNRSSVMSIGKNESSNSSKESKESNNNCKVGDKMEVTFSSVTLYPQVVHSDPSVYENTSKYKVPWGEFVSESIIFTMPSQMMKHIPNFDETFKYIENIVTLTANYMNYQIVRPYRIVFDIETTDEYEYQQQQLQYQLLQQQIQFISQKNTLRMTAGSVNSTQGPLSTSSCTNVGGSYHNTDFNKYIENSIKTSNPVTINNSMLDSSNNVGLSMVVSRYPIVLLLEDINDLFFNTHKMNAGLFKLIMSIAIVSFREGVFDDTTELALSAFVATNVFAQLFSSYDPFEQPIMEMPLLFNELWMIHSHINKKIIPEIIKKSQDDDTQAYEVPQDRWIAFVIDLSNMAKINFSSILKKVKPIPLNAISTLETLKNPPQIAFPS